jgi:hypothetical protein
LKLLQVQPLNLQPKKHNPPKLPNPPKVHNLLKLLK